MHLRRIIHVLNTNIRCSRQVNNVHIQNIPDHFLFLHKYSVYGQKRTRKENIFNPRLAYKLTTKTTATVTSSKITQPKTIASHYPPSLGTDYCHEASTFRMPDSDANVYFAEWLFFVCFVCFVFFNFCAGERIIQVFVYFDFSAAALSVDIERIKYFQANRTKSTIEFMFNIQHSILRSERRKPKRKRKIQTWRSRTQVVA